MSMQYDDMYKRIADLEIENTRYSKDIMKILILILILIFTRLRIEKGVAIDTCALARRYEFITSIISITNADKD